MATLNLKLDKRRKRKDGTFSYYDWEYIYDFKDTYTYEKLEKNFNNTPEVLDLCRMWVQNQHHEDLYILRANENLDTYVEFQEFVVDNMIDTNIHFNQQTKRGWAAYMQEMKDSTAVIINISYK